MKKRAGGAKRPKRNLPKESLTLAADAGTPKLRKTKRALEVELSYAQHVISEQTNRLVSNAKQYDTEKKEWQRIHGSRELELRGKVVEAAAHLIESLCRMVGGPGY